MDGQIDPAADALWDSVAYIASTSGVEDRQPRTEAQWRAVRAQALKLIEGTDLLAMPGRRVAVGSTPVGEGESTPTEIQRRIDANRAAFVQFAGALRQTGLQALAAIDARDAQALLAAGSQIDEACESCHLVYWYPNQGRAGASR
jgi:cytochrome c556